MLISHTHRFIYLKTSKTAGTSVELFFQKYCVPPDIAESTKGSTDEIVSDYGIVGFRGQRDVASEKTWRNHMPGSEVKSRVGDDIWNTYYKFCVVRNPFDKVVSWWWFELDRADRNRLSELPFSEIFDAFNRDVRQQEFRWPVDRNIYEIDNEPIVDYFIQFERLEKDIANVCKNLGLDCDFSRMFRLKSDRRKRKESFELYYDSGSEQMVEERFHKEISLFGYSLRGST